MESEEPQRIVVVHDASRDLSAEGIMYALEQLDLRPGDKLALVAILDRFSTPKSVFFSFCSLARYKIRSDDSSFIAKNKKIVEEELAKKREHYADCPHIRKLSEHCQREQIALHLEVRAGYAPAIAVNAAQDLRATWLIFNRQMKQEHKYFLDKLPCGILRITSNNSIEKIRTVPKLTRTTTAKESLNNIEMIPRGPQEEFSPKRPRSLSSEQLMATGGSNIGRSEASISNHAPTKYCLLNHPEVQKIPIRKQEIVEHDSLFYTSLSHEKDQTEVNNKGRPVDMQQPNSSNNEASLVGEEFTNPMCSVCKIERPKIEAKRDFSYSELYKATQGFSDKNFLSEGGFGSIFKGQLNGMTIAVKHRKNSSLQGEKEFNSEVNVLSKARHENVVTLLGSCSEGNARLLVYEYVCNGSLDQHLSQHSRTPLSWENRIRIAIGTAKGLLYLHENGIVHRDMRPSNILITHDYEPLLGDFGFARTQNHDSIHSTEVVGVVGYLAPEYCEHGKVSAKTDVYAFGVVLLQLITGMSTTDRRLGGTSLVGWAMPILKERNYPDLIDERIITIPDFRRVFWVVRIAERCLIRNPKKRLNMLTVVNALNQMVEGNDCPVIYSYYSSSESVDESEGELESLSTEFPSSGSMSQMSQISGGA
ncbi:hypothetical protein L6164_023223 [Bauhinia variegata]|uniref:Uncharacterized protein n=1 Tax=Bauhinia variegata TaxID=167791 RepID=A0ACB9MHX0_BAUVA|nr:hypothetical protein L6164_023223 [Bauhinia variegata]